MTDEQKERIFSSIENFDFFLAEMEKRKHFRLSDKIIINFKHDFVNLIIENEPIKFSHKQFDFLLREFVEQKNIDVKNEKYYQRKDLAKRRLNELTYIDKNTYKVEDEFYENMVMARDVGSAQGTFKKKLGIIVKALRRGDKIMLKGKIISSLTEFENEIKCWYGFKSLEHELKK